MDTRSRLTKRKGKRARNLRPLPTSSTAAPTGALPTSDDAAAVAEGEAAVAESEAALAENEPALVEDEATAADIEPTPSASEEAPPRDLDEPLSFVSGTFRSPAPEEAAPPAPEDPSEPAAEARRARPLLRGLAVAAALLVASLAVARGGKALLAHRAPTPARASVAAPPTAALPPAPTAPPSPAPPPPPADARTAVVDAPRDPASAAAPPAAPAPAEAHERARVEPKASDPPAADETLKREVLALLNRGASAEAIPLARRVVEADPTDALGYLYLGSALQDVGRRTESLAVYSACVRTATRGPVRECSQLGGRR